MVAKSIATTVARSVVPGIAGSGVSAWQALLDDAALIFRLNGDANGDGTGDANDTQGSYNGTWTGTPTYDTAPSQTDGKAFVTNTGQYVSLAYSSLTGLTDWTVCAWVNVTVNNASGSPFFGAISTQSAPTIRSSGTAWQAFAIDGAGTVYVNLTTAGSLVAIGAWRHLAITYDATDGCKIYNSGTDVTPGGGTNLSGKTSGNNGLSNIRLGGFGGSAAVFNGKISDARAYSRALSASEITDLVSGI